MPRMKKQQPMDSGSPEELAESLMQDQAEQKGGGQEVEPPMPRTKKAASGGTVGRRSGGLSGNFYARRSKL